MPGKNVALYTMKRNRKESSCTDVTCIYQSWKGTYSASNAFFENLLIFVVFYFWNPLVLTYNFIEKSFFHDISTYISTLRSCIYPRNCTVFWCINKMFAIWAFKTGIFYSCDVTKPKTGELTIITVAIPTAGYNYSINHQVIADRA